MQPEFVLLYNIVKFFFNKEPDIAGLLEGRDVVLTGKIKQHDVSKFSQCKETVINYVKVEEKGWQYVI